MQLILLENIMNLGKIGDTVKVKNGYGRNFLLKQGKALRANKENIERAVVNIRYEGYIGRQKQDIAKLNRLNELKIPVGINYHCVLGLRTESRDKLIQLKPKTILEAKKIAGINPADLMIVISNVRR